MEAGNILKKELAFYTEHKAAYLKRYEEQYVLIKGEHFIGAFTTEAQAYQAGVERFGNQSFLIKQVLPAETIVSYPALTVGMIHATL